MAINKVVAGSAREFSFVASGYTVDSIFTALTTASDTLVGCGVATSSGNGHYYTVLQVSSDTGYYTARWSAAYGLLADGNDAYWYSTEQIEVVLEGEDS